MKRYISFSTIAFALLLASCSSSNDKQSSSPVLPDTQDIPESEAVSEAYDPEAGKYDYEEVPLIWELCGTWHLNDTKYPDAEFSVSMDDNGTCYASYFNLMNEDTGAFCEFDDIALTESGNCIEGVFDTDSWGNSGTVLIEFEPDPDPKIFGTFYLTINTTSYGEYKDSDRYAAHIDHVALTSGDAPLSDETIFKQHLSAEERSQKINFYDLLRNPMYYADDSLYRISGTIAYLSRDANYSFGCLQLPNSQTIICFDYPGWLECIEGDFVLFYGTFSDRLGEYQSNGISYQTANMTVRDYILRSSDPVKEAPVLSDYEWNFISDIYSIPYSAYPLEQSFEFTSDSFNGRPYTLNYVQHNVAGNQTSTHTLSDEAIELNIDTTDQYGKAINVSLTFHFSGQLFVFGKQIDSV